MAEYQEKQNGYYKKHQYGGFVFGGLLGIRPLGFLVEPDFTGFCFGVAFEFLAIISPILSESM